MSTTLNTPRIQPDETLYSYIARCQFLWAGTNYRSTSFDWFGKEGVCIDQCIPTHVKAISNHVLYECSSLILNHTAFPLHRLFNRRHEALKQAMLSDYSPRIANLSCASHLAQAELNVSKYCPLCLEEDLAKLGVAYWHLSHQITGVNACWKHQCQLFVQPYNARNYVLPEISLGKNKAPVKWANMGQSAFAFYVNSLLCDCEVQSNCCAPLIKDLLTVKGFVTSCDRIRMNSLLSILKKFEDTLGLPSVLNPESIRSLADSHDLSVHPIKPIVLRFALERLPDTCSVTSCAVAAQKKTNDIAEKTESLLRTYEFSMREISRRMKVSVGFIKQLAKRKGIAVDERRQFITADMQRNIIDLAIAGIDRKLIASQFGISVGAVEQLIQSVRGLSVWRQYLRMLAKRNEARKRLKRAIGMHSTLSRTEIRKQVPQEYTLLYKYDKAWLFEALPKISKRQYHGYKQWLNRDQMLLPKLKKAIRGNICSQGVVPSQYELDKAFGCHGWFTRSFEKMPLCWRYYRRVHAKFPNEREKRDVKERRDNKEN